MHATWLIVALMVGLLGGCANPVGSYARFFSGGEPAVLGIVPTQARVLVSVVRAAPSGPRLQAVENLTFDGADLTLSNATLLAGDLNKTIALAGSSAAAVFSGLKPGGDYTFGIALKNGLTQVGTGYAADIDLPAGVTTSLTVVIGEDGEVEVQASSVGNAVGTAGAWTLAKGDTLTLSTGFAAVEASAAKMHVVLSSELYGAEIVIAEKTADFDQFTWATGSDATTGGYLYDADNLTTTGTQNGTITFLMLDADDKVVGRTRLTGVSVVAGATLDLQLD
jgi:hypothetical protein